MGAILKYITYSKASYLAKAVILLMITTRTKKMAAPTRIMKVTIATRLPITTPTLTNDSASSGFISKGCGDGVELSWVVVAVAGGDVEVFLLKEGLDAMAVAGGDSEVFLVKGGLDVMWSCVWVVMAVAGGDLEVFLVKEGLDVMWGCMWAEMAVAGGDVDVSPLKEELDVMWGCMWAEVSSSGCCMLLTIVVGIDD